MGHINLFQQSRFKKKTPIRAKWLKIRIYEFITRFQQNKQCTQLQAPSPGKTIEKVAIGVDDSYDTHRY